MKLPKINLPNFFTALRIVFLLLIFFAYYIDWPLSVPFLLVLALVTDFLDGYLARKYKQGTRFGAFFDQFADKLFVHSLLIYDAIAQLIPFWVIFLLILRDYIAVLIRESSPKNIGAFSIGKAKLILQFALLFLLSMKMTRIAIPYSYFLIFMSYLSLVQIVKNVYLVPYWKKRKRIKRSDNKKK
ncbi:CDP-alcohol phosphatidyltransferase family protein [Candidatus Woesearchaeota archaeon]|nr:CDP-alcohol phosphatidyltransferase family protein [Candidatus Woesearchaeota archaeon]